jgi:hypothetical protein
VADPAGTGSRFDGGELSVQDGCRRITLISSKETSMMERAGLVRRGRGIDREREGPCGSNEELKSDPDATLAIKLHKKVLGPVLENNIGLIPGLLIGSDDGKHRSRPSKESKSQSAMEIRSSRSSVFKHMSTCRPNSGTTLGLGRTFVTTIKEKETA